MSTALEPSIAAPGLVVPAAPGSGSKSQFILFNDSWIQLQGYVAAALELPVDKAGFEAKYGSVGTSTTFPAAITAMKAVNGAAAQFGNPGTLRAALLQDPNLLATERPPDEIYTHAIWLGQRVHLAAGRIASGYESVLNTLPGLPSAEQLEHLRAYLFDETMGPVPVSERMARETRALAEKLRAFEQKMNEYNEKLREYTKATSKMVTEVDSIVGSLTQRIKELQVLRDEAYVAWQTFVVASVSTFLACGLIGAVLFPVTGGVSLLVGMVAGFAAGVGLGIKSERALAEYNAYCAEITSSTVELRKKQRLRSDLGDFDLQTGRIAPALTKFRTNLESIEGAWTRMRADMLAINQSANEGNIASMPFLVKAKATEAIDAWKDVDQSARRFTADSLIDYASISFGEKMPVNLPARNLRSSARLEEQAS
jgi:hypothetical protein